VIAGTEESLVAKEKQCLLDLSHNHLKRYLTFGSYILQLLCHAF